MKLGFVHDHPFIINNGEVMTSGGLPSSVWNTYVFGDVELKAIGRRSYTRKSNTSAEANNVSFYLVKGYSGPKDFFTKRSKVKKELATALEHVEGVIIRLPSFLGLLAQEICEEQKIPYAVEVVGNAYDAFYNYNFVGKLFASYIHLLTKKAIYKSPRCIYVTKEYLQNTYPCKNVIDYASDVEIDLISDNELQKRLHKIKNFNASKIVCGTIGNLEVRYKGYEEFFKVMARLKKTQNINIEYQIAGTGSKEYLENLVTKYELTGQVKFVGKLSREEVFTYLDNLDLYIHPSFQEGLPRVVVEAMSRACPCLTSSIGGMPELLKSDYMHTAGDNNKLYSDVIKVIEGKYNLEEMALENLERAKDFEVNFLKNKRRKFWSDFYQSISK